MAIGPEGNAWSALLEETRQALSTLHVEELEELAGRAECLLRATQDADAVRQRLPLPERKQMAGIARQHRLLGELLHATERNMAVLRPLRDRVGGRHPAGEGNLRWVR